MKHEATLHWPGSHQAKAKREGWRISLNSRSAWDEVGVPYARIIACAQSRFNKRSDNGIEGDVRARDHVSRMADAGSLFHQKALAYVASKVITDGAA
jgi:hypothetical protein